MEKGDCDGVALWVVVKPRDDGCCGIDAAAPVAVAIGGGGGGDVVLRELVLQLLQKAVAVQPCLGTPESDRSLRDVDAWQEFVVALVASDDVGVVGDVVNELDGGGGDALWVVVGVVDGCCW